MEKWQTFPSVPSFPLGGLSAFFFHLHFHALLLPLPLNFAYALPSSPLRLEKVARYPLSYLLTHLLMPAMPFQREEDMEVGSESLGVTSALHLEVVEDAHTRLRFRTVQEDMLSCCAQCAC